MVRLFLPRDSEIEYLKTIITIASLTGVVTKHPTIGARKVERKERPKLTRVDFIFDRWSPASRVERSVLSEVLTSSPRIASRRQILFDDPRSSCLSIPLRGSCHKIDTTFGGAFLAYLRGCRIEYYLWQSSPILRPREAPVMMWHYFTVRIGGLCLH